MGHQGLDVVVRQAFDWFHQSLVILLESFFESLEGFIIFQVCLDLGVGIIFDTEFLSHLGLAFAISSVAFGTLGFKNFLGITGTCNRGTGKPEGEYE